MFIICQKEFDFGEDYNEVMDVRLRKFYFRSLIIFFVVGVQQYLKDNVMDCFVWVSRVVRTSDDELFFAIFGLFVEQYVIGDEEKDRIRNFRLEDSESDRDASEEVEQNVVVGDSLEEGEDEDDFDVNFIYSDGWEKILERIF